MDIPECPLFPKAVIRIGQFGLFLRSAFGQKRTSKTACVASFTVAPQCLVGVNSESGDVSLLPAGRPIHLFNDGIYEYNELVTKRVFGVSPVLPSRGICKDHASNRTGRCAWYMFT